VEVYTTSGCKYCVKAKKRMREEGVPYEEIDVNEDKVSRSEMSRRAGGRTSVPQIFVAGEHVGGCDDL
ncbi:hypothetical protein GUITHDRAFT_61218, partial [Guillardia theta CCMP2712]